MKRILLTLLAVIIFTAPSFAWGREGHEVIAKIAENNLKPSVKKKVEKYLGGHSIVYYAKWMDDYRRTPEYIHTNKWHTAPVNADLKYDDSLMTKVGNAIYGLESSIDTLKNYKELSDSTVAANIKYVVHIVGDMHCPSHIKYTTFDWDYNVIMKTGEKVTLHTAWDSAIIKACVHFSSTEWAEEIDLKSKKEIAEIVSGTPRDWFHESAERCAVQFEWTSPNSKINQDILNAAMPLVERQVLYAGYRLAEILNKLF